MPGLRTSSSSRSNSVLDSSISALAAPHPPGVRLDAQVAELQRGRLGGVVVGLGPPQQGAHPGEQLVELERLGQVVVGAGIEPGDAVGGLRACGEHQDRQAVAFGPQHPATVSPSTLGIITSRIAASGRSFSTIDSAAAPSGRLEHPVALQAEGASNRDSRIARSSSARRIRPLVIGCHSLSWIAPGARTRPRSSTGSAGTGRELRPVGPSSIGGPSTVVVDGVEAGVETGVRAGGRRRVVSG